MCRCLVGCNIKGSYVRQTVAAAGRQCEESTLQVFGRADVRVSDRTERMCGGQRRRLDVLPPGLNTLHMLPVLLEFYFNRWLLV